MDCVKCGQWNADDRNLCWRCDAELPKPVEKKKKKQPVVFLGLPLWSWVLVIAMMIVLFAGQCLGPQLLGR
jgi:hypothetical protein